MANKLLELCKGARRNKKTRRCNTGSKRIHMKYQPQLPKGGNHHDGHY